ncbi:MAG: HigA family addiction module antitoxin [Erysipelotrichaceae bacterium]
MSSYIEYNNEIAFHPGYYINEIVEASGLTQKDFANKLGTTPKNLSLLIRGEQSLSIDMANKLSRMLGTTIKFWLNLQQLYDEQIAKISFANELEREKEIFKLIDYKYFCNNFGLPNMPRKVDEQIKCLREFLSIFSLSVLEQPDFMVNFRSYSKKMTKSNIVNANTMVQIAINKAIEVDAPKFDKKKFEKAISFARTQTKNHVGFLPIIKDSFKEAGVILVVLPNLKGSGVNGATKKVDGKVLLMVNDRRQYADTFWFTLFHEIGHIMNNDFGITFNDEVEDEADLYAQDILIPREKYLNFIENNQFFNEDIIIEFAESIDQDPGIVFGRLQKDGKISYKETNLAKKLRHKYKVVFY